MAKRYLIPILQEGHPFAPKTFPSSTQPLVLCTYFNVIVAVIV